MRKAITYSLILLAACAGAYEISRHWTLRAQGTISVRPFTLEFASYDSAGQLLEDRITGRRGDGSEVLVGVRPQGATRRIDFMQGSSMMLIDAMKIRMSGKLAAERTAARKVRLLNPPKDCLWPYDVLESHEVVGGVPVNVVEMPRGNSRTIEKRAPDYACASLAAKGEDKQPDGTWRTRWEERFVQFRPGEPDSRLFEPGNGYREMSPSQVRAEALHQQGVTRQACPACFARSDASLDAEYKAAQAR